MEQIIKVLIVDDETRFRNNIVKILTARGFEARGAEDGETALALMRDEPCDVVLLDMKMPGLSGTETLRRLRKQGTTAEVVVLTGHASGANALDTMELGAVEYLTKPAPIEDLVEKVRLAGKKKLQREKSMELRPTLPDVP